MTKEVKPARVQSPSSIKTFKQCPRKYFYTYIEKIETAQNIHTIRGKIAHSVLEDFFDIELGKVEESEIPNLLRKEIQQTFIEKWRDANLELSALELTEAEEINYFEETMLMLFNWLDQFLIRLKSLDEPLQQAFEHLKPIREKQYISKRYSVRGFIDAIENIQGSVRIMDYKTNSYFKIEDHKLQLAIYSLLYQEEHGKLPDFVGIYFLKDREQIIEANEELIELAKKEIFDVHEKTQSREIFQYPMKISRLCKWKTGQCDFYDHCFKK